jgi:hypothetical protein
MASRCRHPYCQEEEQNIFRLTIGCGISRAKYKIYGNISIQNILKISYKVFKCYTESVICSSYDDYESF